MKRFQFFAVVVAVSLLGAVHSFSPVTHAHSHDGNVFTPDTIRWAPAPPLLRPGAQIAVLEGDPTASTGDYTIRLKMPDGFRISPHWHPLRENVTIISGTFKVGMGDDFDTSKMQAFTAGSFAFLDPNMHHYAMASGETVVQVHGQSPVQFSYVHPEDDPSRAK
jgi:Domain of unknown function (DUF4437)